MPNQDTDAERTLLEFYRELGQWARHYSAVRMILGIFFITMSFALLQLRWDNPHWLVALASVFVFAFGAYFFSFFTRSAFKRMNDQIQIAQDLRRRSGLAVHERPPRALLTAGDGLLPVLLFGAVFLLVVFLWVRPSL